jgi:hypothetical protein
MSVSLYFALLFTSSWSKKLGANDHHEAVHHVVSCNSFMVSISSILDGSRLLQVVAVVASQGLAFASIRTLSK